METEWDPTDPVGETKWLHKLYEETGFPNAIVGQAWFDRSDIDQVLTWTHAVSLNKKHTT